jgi:hypothetical protein
MRGAAEILRLKLLSMGEEIKFLEYIWDDLPVDLKDYLLNNYSGKIPAKYLK